MTFLFSNIDIIAIVYGHASSRENELPCEKVGDTRGKFFA